MNTIRRALEFCLGIGVICIYLPKIIYKNPQIFLVPIEFAKEIFNKDGER